jgi:hypothetical protein
LPRLRPWLHNSLLDNNISDLGSTTCGWVSVLDFYTAYTCSPLHDVMNATFVVVGFLTIAGVIGTRRVWPQRRLARVGVGLLVCRERARCLQALHPKTSNL